MSALNFQVYDGVIVTSRDIIRPDVGFFGPKSCQDLRFSVFLHFYRIPPILLPPPTTVRQNPIIFQRYMETPQFFFRNVQNKTKLKVPKAQVFGPSQFHVLRNFMPLGGGGQSLSHSKHIFVRLKKVALYILFQIKIAG